MLETLNNTRLSTSTLETAWTDFARLLPPSQLLSSHEATRRFGKNTLGQSRRIAGVLYPTTSDDIVAIMAIARKHGVALYPVSTGNNWGYGCATPTTDDAFIVHLSQMNRVKRFDEELGIITIEPGVTLGQLWEYLHDRRSPYLMPATGAGPKTSLVGNALERGYGVTAYSDTFGACLSLKAILPDGTLYQSPLTNASAHEIGHKWGVGPYLDGIFSHGNFGIVTEMTFALRRCPREIACVMFEMKSDDKLVDATESLRHLVRNLGGLIGPVKITGHHRAIAEVTNNDELRHKNPWLGFMGVYAEGAMQKAALNEMREHLLPHVHSLDVVIYDTTLDEMKSEDGSPCTRADGDLCRILAGKPTEFAIGMTYLHSPQKPSTFVDLDPQRDGCGVMWFSPLIPFKSKTISDYLTALRQTFDKHGFLPAMTFTSLSDRCLDSAVAVMFNAQSASETEKAKQCVDDFTSAGKQFGFVPYRLTTATMASHKPCDGYSHLRQSIKNAVDPLKLIAPGRYE